MFGLTPFRLYAYGAVVLAVVLTIGVLKLQVNHYKKANAQLEQKAFLAVSANQELFTTVQALKAANAKWQKACKPAEIFLKLQEDQLRAQEKIASLVKENSFLRAKDENLPQCVALLQASLSRRCPSISAGLRLLANPENDHGGSPRAGGKADPR